MLNEDIDYMNREHMQARYIYIIECEGMFKVGLTASVDDRLRALQKSCPFPMKVRHYRRVERLAARRVEAAIHEMLKAHHLHGEWFSADYAIVLAAFKSGVTTTRGALVTAFRQGRREWLAKAAKREGVEF